jgi:sporulation protein YlmC with PRC-barrel domain
MIISAKGLINLPVFTLSGIKLGKVNDVQLDIDAQVIAHYVVASGSWKKKTFLIAPAQVRSITAERMTVNDALATEFDQLNASKIKLTPPAMENAGLATKNYDQCC